MTTPQGSEDQQRFVALFEDAYDEVLRFVRRRLEDGAEDVTAEAFLVAWRRLDDLPADHGDARAWVFGIARGIMANSRRAGSRRDALAVRLVDSGSARGIVDDEDDSAVLRIDLATAWNSLAPAEQEVLSLAVLDGLTSAQAAEVLGISAVAFRLRLSRARRRLRASMEARPAPSPPRRDSLPVAARRPAAQEPAS
ncbi:hypothetical protein GCM10028787_28060 [Brachybacterium horti]